MIAECYHLYRRWAVWLPTFRLVDLSACWLSDLLACRFVGKLAGVAGGRVRSWGTCERGQKDSEGAAVQKRTDARSGAPETKKRGWAHPPPSFPHERGEEERRVHPPIVTEQGTEKSEE